MARKGTFVAAVCVLLGLLCVGFSYGVAVQPKSKDGALRREGRPDQEEPPRETATEKTPHVPIYVRKRQQYAKRRAAFEMTMQTRMTALAQTTSTFATRLYRRHVSGTSNSSSNVIGSGRRKFRQDVSSGNVLLAPLSAYASLAMTMTSSKGRTKREVIAALAMEGEGRGVHAALERALTSLGEDDTASVYENDDIKNNIDMDVGDDADDDEDGDGRGDDGLDNLSDAELEKIIRNDYALDNRISYGTGQSQIRYSAGVSSANNNPTPPKPKPKYTQIRLANGMFHSEDVGLLQQYSNRLVSLYGAPPMAMQKQEPEVSVNLWVDAVTGGAVPDMLGAGDVADDNDAWIVLVSAFSFRGEWQANFDEVVQLHFRTGSGRKVDVSYMYRAGNYSVKTLNEMGNAKVVEIPYANTRYSLYVFLPRTARRIHDLEEAFKTRPLRDLIGEGGSAMPEPAMTILMIPKFHLTARTRLDPELQAEGVHRLFAKGKADLRRMTGENKKTLFVARFFQHANLEVDTGDVQNFKTGNRVEVGGSDDLEEDGSILRGGEPGDEMTSNSSQSLSESPEEQAPSEDVHGKGDEEVSSKVADEGGDAYTDGDDYDDDEYYDEYNDDWADEEEEEGEGEESGDSTSYVIADKPFLFVVLDKQYDLILSMGRVMNPLP